MLELSLMVLTVALFYLLDRYGVGCGRL